MKETKYFYEEYFNIPNSNSLFKDIFLITKIIWPSVYFLFKGISFQKLNTFLDPERNKSSIFRKIFKSISDRGTQMHVI